MRERSPVQILNVSMDRIESARISIHHGRATYRAHVNEVRSVRLARKTCVYALVMSTLFLSLNA